MKVRGRDGWAAARRGRWARAMSDGVSGLRPRQPERPPPATTGTCAAAARLRSCWGFMASLEAGEQPRACEGGKEGGRSPAGSAGRAHSGRLNFTHAGPCPEPWWPWPWSSCSIPQPGAPSWSLPVSATGTPCSSPKSHEFEVRGGREPLFHPDTSSRYSAMLTKLFTECLLCARALCSTF